MNIQEDKKPRTAPIKTAALLKVIEFVKNSSSSDINFSNISTNNSGTKIVRDIVDNLKLIGISRMDINDGALDDYIFSFIKQNEELLDSGDFEPEKYMIPEKKKFKWTGYERYVASVIDTYSDQIEGYSEEYIKFLYRVGEYSISDGHFQRTDTDYVENEETAFDSFEEAPMNEEISKDLRRLQDLFG